MTDDIILNTTIQSKDLEGVAFPKHTGFFDGDLIDQVALVYVFEWEGLGGLGLGLGGEGTGEGCYY